MSDPVIVSAVRTAIGKFGGGLQEVPAPTLGAVVLREALARCGTEAAHVDEVIMGMIYQGGQGPNPARQAAVQAGIPYAVPATTINKLCGSGLKAIALAGQAVALGEAEVIVAGGMESMSRVPHALLNSRWGERLGHGKLADLMLMDGLWDCFYDCHMGMTAENLATQYGISRTEQDRFAAQSQARYQQAVAADLFAGEIVPVPVPQRKGEPLLFAQDEHPRADSTADKLVKLPPAFREEGTVTAGNASGINDGAAAVVVMSANGARQCGLKPQAHLRAAAAVGVDPAVMGIGPAPAIRRLLDKAGMRLDQIDLIEVNEAFAAQVLAVGRELDWDEEQVNVKGGAIALGHPVGASGARLPVTLLAELERRQLRWGIAALCIGGGMGIAALFERVD
ncbi:MAG: acetyl-CoA C-acetyltransferase [Candidatus Handelsmanbacteria bacterium]|nr:acetyl-CoA C-acetyltransferase [Candidatus Handelsmanbacteria bacterium]